MSDDAHVLEDLPVYAIGSLDEAEAQRVAKHVAACVICRRELEVYQAIADQLVLTFPDAAPSADTKQLLIDRIQSLERKPFQSSRSKESLATVRPETKMGWRGLFPVVGVIGLLLTVILA